MFTIGVLVTLVVAVTCAPAGVTNEAAAPVEATPVVTLTPAEIRAAAIAKHTAALHRHNTDNVMWAVVPKPLTPEQKRAQALEAYGQALISHNLDDVYWAVPVALRPKPVVPTPVV